VHEIRRLKLLEKENRRLEHLVGDLTLDNLAFKGFLNRKHPILTINYPRSFTASIARLVLLAPLRCAPHDRGLLPD
jgi:hypothetical protein